MVRNDSLFYLSGFISFLLFFSVITLFGYMLVVQEMPKSFALKKDTFIKVSIDLTQDKPIKKQKKQVKKIEESIVKKQEPQKKPAAKPADFSSLFSNVKAEKIEHNITKPIKRKVNDAQIKQIQKRIKTTSKRDSNANKAIKSLEVLKSSNNKNTKTISTASEINKRAALVTQIIYSKFLVDTSMLGNITRIYINIDSVGKLISYRILQTSSSSSLNAEAIKLEERLLHVTFPIAKDYKPYSVEFNLIPEEK